MPLLEQQRLQRGVILDDAIVNNLDSVPGCMVIIVGVGIDVVRFTVSGPSSVGDSNRSLQAPPGSRSVPQEHEPARQS